MKVISVLLLFLLTGLEAQARVFSFSKESFAAYFRGTYGLSRLAQTPFEGTVDNTVTYSGESTEHKSNFSGELGFLLNVGEQITFRIGAEIIQSKLSDVKVSNSGGTELFTMNSTAFVFNPVATLEYHFMATDTTRFSVFGGAGLSDVSLDIDYQFTATGLSTYSNVTGDYTEKSGALIISAHYGVQSEFTLADTATMVFELGFRHMPVSELKHKSTTATVLGTFPEDSVALDHDGSNRNLDLSGYYAAIAFRFYLSM